MTRQGYIPKEGDLFEAYQTHRIWRGSPFKFISKGNTYILARDKDGDEESLTSSILFSKKWRKDKGFSDSCSEYGYIKVIIKH